MTVKITEMDHAEIQFKTHYERSFKCSGPNTTSGTVIIDTKGIIPKKKRSWIDDSPARAYRR